MPGTIYYDSTGKSVGWFSFLLWNSSGDSNELYYDCMYNRFKFWREYTYKHEDDCIIELEMLSPGTLYSDNTGSWIVYLVSYIDNNNVLEFTYYTSNSMFILSTDQYSYEIGDTPICI